MEKQIILPLLALIIIYSCNNDITFPTYQPEKYNDFYSYLSEEPLGAVLLHPEQVKWRHRSIELEENYTVDGRYSGNEVVDRIFNVIVLENDHVGITLLPEYGGRLLSYYYKPTGTEQLYQNPQGTPFGIGNGSFYYDWLMVYGGLFPTFPEPEHGKTWLAPWEFKIVEDSEERAAVQMWYTDDLDPATPMPQKFNNGTTGLTCRVTYILEKDSTAVEMKVELINRSREDVDYEYWTCITFAPGSEPGNTRTDGNARMIVPLDEVIADYSANNWMYSGQIWPLEKFDELHEWQNQGILYAYPGMTENWYGVLNSNNQQAFLRVSDNSVTPGLKFWTWGHNQGEAVDPIETKWSGERPYIELWSGNSSRFFTNATLEGRETLVWSEFYYPTLGLEEVTFANENGAFHLDGNTLHLYINRPGEGIVCSVISGDTPLWNESFNQSLNGSQIFDLTGIALENARIQVERNGDILLAQDM